MPERDGEENVRPEEKVEKIFNALFHEKDGETAAGFTLKDLTGSSGESDGVRECLGLFAALLAAGETERLSLAGKLKKISEMKEEEAGLASFLLAAYRVMIDELSEASRKNRDLGDQLTELAEDKERSGDTAGREVRNFFFPEGNFDVSSPQSEIERLREKRKVSIDSLSDDPVKDPARELTITSNVLLTVPPEGVDLESLELPLSLKKNLHDACCEEQLYWYDHPVQVGTSPEANEILYGLRNLDEALDFEKERGNLKKDETITCILSISCTHRGLQSIARDYLEYELSRGGALNNLEIYAFTDDDCRRLVTEVLMPAAREGAVEAEVEVLEEIFGVDGEYGRHYSFLKAVNALWQVCSGDELKSTFKIDLDQVFPQELLVSETGKSALEHLASPLWGARGRDSLGRPVHLGMLAGALVNEKDISRGLFTPDVTFGKEKKSGESLFFYSGLPQALSTEGEMMTRYDRDTGPDGETECIHRIHVTGGTNGIRIDALRRYRPFTPGFIGRAEDQAYLLSVLFASPGDGMLRYCHQAGLIMRHDKEAFAGEAIEAARIGKLVGDYLRILFFSFYAEALEGTFEDIKEVVDPFTGSFISRLPFTVVLLRMVFKAAEFYLSGAPEDGRELALMAAARLKEYYEKPKEAIRWINDRYHRESRGWNSFYDILDMLEKAAVEGKPTAMDITGTGKEILESCRVRSVG